MGWRLGKFVVRIYLVLWMTAVGGVIGANLTGTFGTLFVLEQNRIEDVTPWWHGGWCIGTLLFFFGAAFGRLRMIQGSSFDSFKEKKELATRFVDGDSEEIVEAVSERGVPAKNVSFRSRLRSLSKGVFVGSLAGGFLGILLGGSLLVFWMSIAYSPFAPSTRTVLDSSSENRQQFDPNQQRRMRQGPGSMTVRSRSSVGLYVCLVPMLLGATFGGIGLGGIAWVYPEDSDPEVEKQSPTE